ncbi:MAG: HD domain-containing protein, partial [Anaerolineae bacterium]|nr:HD domain-containing protein [Anaerolineae bacterium]
DVILNKSGPLTDVEWTVMKQHPVMGYEMLKEIVYLKPALDIPYSHHERWDGSGYPLGICGEAIPLAARIFAVVDVYDALRSSRSYRVGIPKEEALASVQEKSGKHFDPEVVDVFVRMMKEKGDE